MNILVVNDDGIKAPGIRALVRALSEAADVYVCAPDGQRSAKSHSVTLGQPVIIQPVEFPCAKEAYQTSGSPADCTKIGLQFFEEAGIKIDMVYSGINMGSNLGRDTLYSGTVGAAAEAALSGYHAVAVSADNHEATHFDVAGQLAVDVIEKVYRQVDPHTVISINVPDLPREEIRGVKFVRLGQRYYDDKFHLIEDNKYELSGQPADFTDESQEFDVTAVANHYATITPLQFDFTDYENLETVKKWGFNI